MSREELQAILRFQDRKSFREYSLKPALRMDSLRWPFLISPIAACNGIVFLTRGDSRCNYVTRDSGW